MSGNERHSVKLMYLHHIPQAVLVQGLTAEEAWMGLDVVEVADNLDAQQRGNTIEVDAPYWILAKYGLDVLV